MVLQAAPDHVGASAEVNDAPGEAFVHGDVGFSCEGIARVEACAIALNALLIPQSFAERLSERYSAIFDGVMGVYLQIAFAAEVEVEHAVLREEREHVIEKRNASVDSGLPLAVDVQLDLDLGLFGGPADVRLARLHFARNKAQSTPKA